MKFNYPIFISADMDLPLRRKKIAEYYHLDEFDAEVVANATRIAETEPILVQESEWPKINAERQAVITDLSECMKKTGALKFPLYKTEVPQGEIVTYLKEPFLEFRAGTAVWMRKTNLGTVYIFADIYGIDHSTGKVGFISVEPQLNIDHYAAMQDNSIASDILLSFAKGLVGQLGSKTGSAVISAIFGGSGGLDYKQLLQDIRTVLKEELKNILLETEYGKGIDGVINHMTGYYSPRKASGQSSKQELYNYILDKQSSVNSVIGMLKRDEFKKQGISLFIAAASLDLALYQELALQDPTVTDAMRSSNIAAIKQQAENYKTFANQVLNDIQSGKLKERLDKISGVQDATNDADVSRITMYSYFDKEVSNCSMCSSGDSSKVYEHRRKHIEAVTIAKTIELNNSLNAYRDSVALWSQLQTNPLGK